MRSTAGGELTINGLRWFTPGVGMVKYQREKKSADADAFIAELQSFDQL